MMFLLKIILGFSVCILLLFLFAFFFNNPQFLIYLILIVGTLLGSYTMGTIVVDMIECIFKRNGGK